ncbi:MAG: hypothetical protein ACFFBE_05825 [Promethearchaeota archaeon]
MNIKKLKLSTQILLFFMFLFSSTFLTTIISENPTLNNTDLKTNADEIIISTPMNKTYLEPMSGYYPGTWGFENDKDGVVPQGWVDNSQSGCSVSVVSEKMGHNKVIHLDDDSGNKIYFDGDFTNQSYGTIEMWILAENCTYGFMARLVDRVSLEQVIRIGIGADKWVYYNGGASNKVFTALDGVYDPIDNTWYHLRIHFRCNGAPSYQALSENKVKIEVDGYISEEVDVWNVKDNIGRLAFATTAAFTTDGWVDAIGCSWDVDYDIGDNKNEGLLLSFDINFTPNWLSYSLDGISDKTILGDTTIYMLPDGVHSVQVFGNDTMGTMYESELRYFTIGTKVSTPLDIPGYNLLILIGIIGVVGIGLGRKKLRKQNLRL